jgi:ABC-2 type transport system ATP-binding protein
LLGMPVRVAKQRAYQCLSDVDLTDVAGKPVSTYSHGMQKRLSVARALLGEPALLLVDESTHDLDPAAARRVQELVSAAARRSAAVLWATQRLDEIRAFADHVIVLSKGRVLFSGSVPGLLALQRKERYVLRLRPERPLGDVRLAHAAARLVKDVTVLPVDAEHVLIELGPGAVLGHVISDLTQCGMTVLACREERSGIEAAFLSIVESGPP